MVRQNTDWLCELRGWAVNVDGWEIAFSSIFTAEAKGKKIQYWANGGDHAIRLWL